MASVKKFGALCGEFSDTADFVAVYISEGKFLPKYLIQLIEHPILGIPNFNIPNLRCWKVLTSYIGIFKCTYFDIDLKLLSGKNTQK